MSHFFKFGFMVLMVLAICITGFTIGWANKNNLEGNKKLERECEIRKDSFPESVIEVVKIANLDSDNFLDDFFIEIKNISDKPIYSIYLVGSLPNSRKYINESSAVLFYFGDPKLIDISKRSRNEDKPLSPGEAVQIKIFENVAKGYKETIKSGKHPIQIFSKLDIEFQTLSFGDGTGYSLTDFINSSKSSNTSKVQPSSSATKNSMAKGFVASRSSATSNSNLTCGNWKITQTGQCCGSVNGCTMPLAGYDPTQALKWVCQKWVTCNAQDCGGPVSCPIDTLRSCPALVKPPIGLGNGCKESNLFYNFALIS